MSSLPTFALDTDNLEYQTAWDYVNQTQSSIFLTGKAGSGKTTFLRHLKTATLKNCIVVSPTGVAAINAGGVTMHSMFSLPFQPFIEHPKMEHQNGLVMSKDLLLKGLRLSVERRSILQEVQLIIIDEVSMLRCDMLDAIDVILQYVRKNRNPFGGVQMLFIGDMFQLPPVVTENDRQLLSHYYSGFYFFNSNAIQKQTPLYIELKKIYRQSDAIFIEVLNRIRRNAVTRSDFEYLNQRYIPNFEPKDEEAYITLSTRNAVADKINQKKLDHLVQKEFLYKGKIVGDFGEKSFPCPLDLRLKEGAQVMFVRNDATADKRYFNGKLAKVVRLLEDEIFVQFEDSGEAFSVPTETWENIKYGLKPNGTIEEEILGTFTQYPLRLAWAITVHKSQGLTFEKAVLDIGSSFEFGQVYVALSRCKSYEGLVLLNPIGNNVIFSDEQVEAFAAKEANHADLQKELPRLKFENSCSYIFKSFDFEKSLREISDFEAYLHANKSKETELSLWQEVASNIIQLQKVADNFMPQLKQLLYDTYVLNELNKLEERLSAAMVYFGEQWLKRVLEPLENHYKKRSQRKSSQEYAKEFKRTYQFLYQQLINIKHITYEGKRFDGDMPSFEHLNLNADNTTDAPKLSTQEWTLKHYNEGKTVAAIAEIRKLNQSTIETHLCYWIEKGKLDAEKLISLKRLEELATRIKKSNLTSLSEIKQDLGEDVSYFELKIAKTWMNKS